MMDECVDHDHTDHLLGGAGELAIGKNEFHQ